MARQETLAGAPGFNPLDHGLWERYVTDGRINHAAWMRACAERAFVGTCRRCGDYLVPEYPEDVAGRTDYTAHCRTGQPWPGQGCSYELTAPSGRVLRRSSRHSEMPAGWWEHRFKTREG